MADSTLALDPRFVTRVRQPGLDLLRAAAVVLVVCYHAGNFGLTLPHDAQRFGWIGVDLFFVLSGLRFPRFGGQAGRRAYRKNCLYAQNPSDLRRGLPLTSVSALVLNFAATLVIGSILYFTVERPFLLLRRRAVRSLPRGTAVPEPSA